MLYSKPTKKVNTQNKPNMKTKNVIACLCLSLAFYGVKAQTKPAKAPVKSTAAKNVTATKEEIQEGVNIMAKSDCFACHKLDEKSIGPSYVDISKKYPMTENNIAALSTKIIKGGSGNWGTMPMAPHASITPEQSKKIVKYILTVSKK
jgi:cytochrome c